MGFKTFLDKLNDVIFDLLDKKFTGKSDETLFEYVALIHDYILRKLSGLIWHPDRQRNPLDVTYRSKVSTLDWIEPRHIELPEAEQTVNYAMWDQVGE